MIYWLHASHETQNRIKIIERNKKDFKQLERIDKEMKEFNKFLEGKRDSQWGPSPPCYMQSAIHIWTRKVYRWY